MSPGFLILVETFLPMNEVLNAAADAVPSNLNEILGAVVTLFLAIFAAFRKGRNAATKLP